MVRVLIIGAVLAVAFSLYGLVDAAMADARRARGLNKPVWVLVIALLPVIGAALWFTIGRGKLPPPVPSEPRMSQRDVDRRMQELEERLRELDEEIYPGEAGADPTAAHPDLGTAAGDAAADRRDDGDIDVDIDGGLTTDAGSAQRPSPDPDRAGGAAGPAPGDAARTPDADPAPEGAPDAAADDADGAADRRGSADAGDTTEDSADRSSPQNDARGNDAT